MISMLAKAHRETAWQYARQADRYLDRARQAKRRIRDNPDRYGIPAIHEIVAQHVATARKSNHQSIRYRRKARDAA